MGANKGKTAMPEFLSDLWNDDRGITSVEYALLLSFVASGLMGTSKNDPFGMKLGV